MTLLLMAYSSNQLFLATSRRLIHTDITFPKYHGERSKAASDSTKAARDTEDFRRATAQGLLFGGKVISNFLTFCYCF